MNLFLFYFTVLLCLISECTLAVPRHKLKQKKDVDNPVEITDAVVIDGNRPSHSFYDHLLGNLQNSNPLIKLAMLPHGIPPPLVDDDYPDTAIPVAHYAFVNPALNGEKTPHWTETLENFKNNPAISDDVKDKVVQSLQNPIKIYGDGTESRFPLLIEYVVQRIQNYFSTYVYEDMSRPASWDIKVNKSDGSPSSDKEPIVEDGKVEVASSNLLFGGKPKPTRPEDDGIDYIIDITLRPDMEDFPDVELPDGDFEKTTEEWEGASAGKVEGSAEGLRKENSTEEPTVIVVKETIDLKVVDPISVEPDSFLYVGDGNGEELLTRSNKRRKLKKKKRN